MRLGSRGGAYSGVEHVLHLARTGFVLLVVFLFIFLGLLLQLLLLLLRL
jgi:hypothetical protein